MARAQAGDQSAYRELLIGVTPRLRAIARRALYDHAEVEDAVQDILLTLHSVRHTYDPSLPFSPWLSGIARHRLLDRIRVVSRRAARETHLVAEHETFMADTPNIEERTLDNAVMRRALNALPAGQRQAIELTKLREMSLRDAAMESGMSVAALKVATFRGLARLRQILAGKDGGA
jgi:RNA polymerase sigma-70 factor (ECF subfamily)